MKIEAVFFFPEISQDFRDKICIFGVRKQLYPIAMVKKNSNKNISNLFKARILKIMFEHMVTECRIC